MKRWEEYQHQAAGLLRELGFKATVNDLIAGANGAVHAVDVSARRKIAGIDVIWVVECKLWNRAIPKERVAALQAIVSDIGADRGLLISEKGFQPGAHEMARAKNITLCSTGYLRMHASDEILAARVAAAEKRLLDLSLRVNRDLRPFTMRTEHMLASFAARLPPEVVEEFAARTEAIEYVDGLFEVQSQVEGLTMEDHLAFMAHPGEMAMPWRPGADEKVLDGVFLNLHYTTQALHQGRLGQWPAMCVSIGREVKLAWSMAQLIDVIEPKLPDLEEKVSEQEARADQTPRLPWFDFIKPGTLPPPHPWGRGSHE